MDRWESKGSFRNEAAADGRPMGKPVPYKPYKPRNRTTVYALTLPALCDTVHWVNLPSPIFHRENVTMLIEALIGRGLKVKGGRKGGRERVWPALRSRIESRV